VSVVKLLVQDQEELILLDKGSHFFGLRPRGSLEKFFGQLGKRGLVQVGDLVTVPFLASVLNFFFFVTDGDDLKHKLVFVPGYVRGKVIFGSKEGSLPFEWGTAKSLD
jgi:hypothetical protein